MKWDNAIRHTYNTRYSLRVNSLRLNSLHLNSLRLISKEKKDIITRFFNNVKGQTPPKNNLYHGCEGHWLEKRMGIAPNSKNEPDIHGYEMKKYSSKITVGDFSASEYLFSSSRPIIDKFNDKQYEIDRTRFIRFAGTSKPFKNNRFSWSGSCVPKYNSYNECGQILEISKEGDICIFYSYEHDQRINKHEIPDFLKKSKVLIAVWKSEKMRSHINNKYNNNGFFICKKGEGGTYEKICFGEPFHFEHFIDLIKNKKIIFDSGMYEGNPRNYSMFRGSYFWNDLITSEF